MDDTTTEQPTEQPGSEPARPAPANGKRERKPPSAEQAKKAAAAKALKRQVEKVLASGDADAMEAMRRKLAGDSGGEEPAAVADTAAPLAVDFVPAAPVAPTAAEVEAMQELAAGLVAMVAEPLAGTDFDPMKPRPNPLGGEPVVMGKELTKALAPVLAKYLPTMVTTPEGQLALTVALWLGPPAMVVARRKMLGEGTTAGAEGAGVKAA